MRGGCLLSGNAPLPQHCESGGSAQAGSTMSGAASTSPGLAVGPVAKERPARECHIPDDLGPPDGLKEISAPFAHRIGATRVYGPQKRFLTASRMTGCNPHRPGACSRQPLNRLCKKYPC
jgi:hypothetical protein